MAEEEFALIMPFVVCRTEGGPYDDEAFVAGYAMGQLDTLLAGQCAARPEAARWRGPVRTALLPQVDLIAMRHDMVVRVLSDDGEWAEVEIAPGT